MGMREELGLQRLVKMEALYTAEGNHAAAKRTAERIKELRKREINES